MNQPLPEHLILEREAMEGVDALGPVHRPLPPGFSRGERVGDTEEYFINMGPQHPSTHGVLRLVLRLDGETVVEVVPHLGYIHRGIEKQAENETVLQYIHLTDRMDYICSHMNNHAVCLAMEKAMGIGVPERGEYIRVMVNELQRIQSHLLFYGCFGVDLGAVTCMLQGFKGREFITDIFDDMCGARLTMNYMRPGGVASDIPDTILPRVKDLLEILKPLIHNLETLVTGNVVIHERSKGIGILTPAKALGFGTTGPVLRGSGISYDLRKNAPYSIYERFKFDVPVGKVGDCYDRYVVRMQEMKESMGILAQCLATFPEGPFRSKEKPSYRLPAGTHYGAVETAKGIFSTTIVAEKGEKPYRIHSRSPNLANVSAMNTMCAGHKIADVITVLATLDPVVPDMDR